MKRLIGLTLAGLFAAFVAYAQPPGGGGQFDPEEMVKRQTERMVEDLGLNADQTKKVEDLNRKYGAKMGELFQSAQGDREGMRAKMDKLREEKDAELKLILTEEQFVKYLEIEKKRREEFRQRAGNRPPGSEPGRRGQQRGTGNE